MVRFGEAIWLGKKISDIMIIIIIMRIFLLYSALSQGSKPRSLQSS